MLEFFLSRNEKMSIFRLAFGFLTVLLRGGESWETRGRSFMLILPSDGAANVQSTVSFIGNEGTTVEIATQDPERSFIGAIDFSGVYNITLSAEHHINMLNETKRLKAVHLSCNESVAVNVITTGNLFAMSYNALPDIAGFTLTHRVVTYCPENITCNSVIAIVGIMNSLNIIVTLKSSSPVTVGGNNYTDGDSLKLSVTKHEIFLLRCKGDLTGTKVYTPFPTNIFSGSYCDKQDDVPICDFTFEHIPPSREWGSSFTLVLFPPLVHVVYRVVGDMDDTVITKDGIVGITLQAGEFTDFVNISEVHDMHTSFPVQVVMFISDSSEQNYYPNAMILLQPTSERRRYYQVMCPERYTSYCQIEAKLDLAMDAWVNEKYLCGKGLYHMETNVSVFNIPEGSNTVGFDLADYGLIVYGFLNKLGYGYAGIPRDRIFPPSEQCPMQLSASSSSDMDSSSAPLSIAFISVGTRNEYVMPSTSPFESSARYPSFTDPLSDLLSSHVSLDTSFSSGTYTPTHVSNIHMPHSTTRFTFVSHVTGSAFTAPVETLEESSTSSKLLHPEITLSSSILHNQQALRTREPDTVMMSSAPIHQISTFLISSKSVHEPSGTMTHGSGSISELTLTSYISSYPEPSTKGMNSVDMEMQSVTEMYAPYNPFSSVTSLLSQDRYDVTSHSSLLLTTQAGTAAAAHVPAFCQCPCWMKNLEGSDDEQLTRLNVILDALRKNLTLDKNNLSVTVRKRISASDSRKAVTGVGVFGTGIVALVFSLVVLGDMWSVFRVLFGWCAKCVNK